jgi:hypothetical protein
MNELTRRAWIVQLGATAVLPRVAPAEGNAPLPPGLYEPSVDHLMHAVQAGSARGDPPAAPGYFTASDYALVAALAALVLGDEPGKTPVPEIAAWLDLVVGQSAGVRAAALALSPAHRRIAVGHLGEADVRRLESEDPQALCREGLAALRRAGFEKLPKDAQLAHLGSLENAGDAFLAWFKRYVLIGFYTSREGLRELDYQGNSLYRISPGCDEGK